MKIHKKIGYGFSVLEELNDLQGASIIIFGAIANDPLIGLGMAINMAVSNNAPVYTFNDLYNDIIRKQKQLIRGW